jgi:hypothetical protein
MDTAEIRKTSSLCKSELVNEAHVGSHALAAIRVTRRTELRIRRAGFTAGDAVAAAVPSPLHRVADGDVDGTRVERKAPTRRYRHIDCRTRTRWHAG